MRGEHIPETEEYNISSVTYTSKRPFHPQRFLNFVQSNLDGVYRVKGYFWLASRMEFVGQINVAGRLAELSPAGKWWAAVPKNEWDMDDPETIEIIKKHWTEPYGDRRQEIVLIGTDMDQADIRQRLDACVLSDAEFCAGPEAWQSYPDPIHAWEFVESLPEDD